MEAEVNGIAMPKTFVSNVHFMRKLTDDDTWCGDGFEAASLSATRFGSWL
jgi:hypothetical protein